MRRAAEDFLREFPDFKSVDGTAENTTLTDKSVDFAIAAQAFHWFEPSKTRREFRRILKDNGFIALLWNERQLDSTDFLRAYEQFLIRFGTDYQTVRHDNVADETLRDFLGNDYRRASFPNVQSLDFAGLRGRVLSSSYMPSETDSTFAALDEELKRLFAEYEKDSRIEILYTANIYYARI